MTLDEMFAAYEADHQHPANRALHMVGITMIGSGVALLPFAPWAGGGLFTLGWGAQFLGHAIEGKPPSLTHDPKFMAVGAVWYARQLKSGLRALRHGPAAPGNER
jgi:uncharacterized membrane protein YGL010W